MKLSRLRPSPLKVYLALIALRGSDDCCRVPLRELSLEAGLGRATCATALRQLHGWYQLIFPVEGGWAVAPGPLRDILGSEPGSCQQGHCTWPGCAAPAPLAPSGIQIPTNGFSHN